jgi:diadenylate cyclase
MNTIVWIAKNVLGFAVTALIIVMQPELRNALEALGKKNFLLSLGFSGSLGKEKEVLSEKTINEIVDAAVAMSKVKTGALIVIEQKESLQEYEKTGIEMDAVVSSQLLENIFEHNTPLHDGAVLIRGNRVASATCYLPLSKNQALSKDLGTRHRAAVGVSEQTDSMTIVVSEETGKISLAVDGVLERGIAPERLKKRLKQSLNKRDEDEAQGKTKKRIWRGKARQQDEEDIA